MVGIVNVPPKAALPLDPVKPLFADIRTGTAGVVAIPLTVEIRFPLVAVNTLLPIIVASVVASTPFIVVLTVFTVGLESVLLLISETFAPTTPLIMVLKLLAAEVLTTVFTAGAVAAIPFTVEVIMFAVLSKVLVVVTLALPSVTKLPEASNPNPLVIFPLAGAKSADTPLTMLVSFPDVPVNTLELITFVEFPVTPLTVVDKIFPVEVLETVVLAATIGLKSVAAVLIPFTLVVKLFPVRTFVTVVTAGALATTPLIVEVMIFEVLLSVLVVGVVPAITKLPEASNPKF